MSTTEDWFYSYDTLITFGTVMRDSGSLMNPEDVLYFFQKPHKWNREFALWEVFERPMEGDENWPQFVEAVIEGAYAEDFS